MSEVHILNDFYTEEEYNRLRDAWREWMLDENDNRSYKEVEISVVGKERYKQKQRAINKWKEEYLLFKVCHPDGREWTDKELEQWVIDKGCETNLIYCDLDTFYIDDEGSLALLDECGNFEFLGSDEFVLEWNRKPVERILEKLKERE